MKPLQNLRLSRTLLFSILCLYGIGLDRDALAASGDEHWDSQFGWPGVNELVLALEEHQGRLYASGLNPERGSTAVPIWMWDGSQWSEIGRANGDYPIVYAAAIFQDDLYVGGTFGRVDGTTAAGLARWDGSQWSQVGGFAGGVLALAADATGLYVGGAFTDAGGVATTNIARWNGSQWQALGAGLGPTGSPSLFEFYSVSALLIHGGMVYAGGLFTESGTIPVQNLARWDGTNWSAIAGPIDGQVDALTVNGPDLYAGGRFTHLAGLNANRIAKWDGISWSTLGSGMNSNVNALAFFDGHLYAGGAFREAGGQSARRIARWNGQAWSALGSGMNDSVIRMVVAGQRVYAGGLFTLGDDTILNHVGGWDGTNWNVLGLNPNQGMSYFVQALATAGTNVYAGGFFDVAGQARVGRTARWDGHSWSALGSGMQGADSGNGNVVRAMVVAKAGTELYAAGAFTNAGGIAAQNIARWNGHSWSALGSGVNDTIFALAHSGTELVAGGRFTMAGGSPVGNIARWDGSNWLGLGSGLNNTVSTITISGNLLYAGGSFTLAGGVTANRIARWNGSSWSPFIDTGGANGMNGPVYAIALDGPNLYAAGRFTVAGSVPAACVAQWNGLNWTPLGNGVAGGNQEIRCLLFQNGSLYAGGSFTNAGGLAAYSIARWDGTNWSALGSSIYYVTGSPRVSAMAALGANLFVGGVFSAAGQKSSYYIARWNQDLDFDAAQGVFLSNPHLGPNGHFRFRVETSGLDSYLLEGSTDYHSWSPLLTNTASPLEYEDPLPAMGSRFYRARTP